MKPALSEALAVAKHYARKRIVELAVHHIVVEQQRPEKERRRLKDSAADAVDQALRDWEGYLQTTLPVGPGSER